MRPGIRPPVRVPVRPIVNAATSLFQAVMNNNPVAPPTGISIKSIAKKNHLEI